MLAIQCLAGAYNPAAIRAGVNAVHHSQMESKHINLKENYKVGVVIIEGLKMLIIFAAGEDNVESLKERYTGFVKSTLHKMIKFLRDNATTQMMALDKDRFKQAGF